MTLEATTELNGIITYTCQNCKITEQETIPMLVSPDAEEGDKSEGEENSYTATFNADFHASVNIYHTQDYTTPDEEDVTSAVARNSATGEVDVTGDGQINFAIVVDEGYEVDSVSIEGTYKNLKDVSNESGASENLYRITKIESDLTVTITTKAVEGEEGSKSEGGDGSKSDNAESSSTTETQDIANATVTGTQKVGTTFKLGNFNYKIVGNATDGSGSVEIIGLTKSSLKKVTIGSTVTYLGVTYKIIGIGKNAFANSKKLTNIKIGTNVTSIGAKAFYKCTKLSKITIPSKVEKIGKQAFYGCKDLKSITIKTSKLTKKNIGSKAFFGIYKNAKIKVPKKKVSAYTKILNARGIGKKVKVTK